MTTIAQTITDLTAGRLTDRTWVLVLTGPQEELPEDLPDLDGTVWLEVGGSGPLAAVRSGNDYEGGAEVAPHVGRSLSQGEVDVEDADALAASILTILDAANGRSDGVRVVCYRHSQAPTYPTWVAWAKHRLGLPHPTPVGDDSRCVTDGPVPTISQERIIRDLATRYGADALHTLSAKQATALAEGGVDGLLATLSEGSAEMLIRCTRADAGQGELLGEVARAASAMERATETLHLACVLAVRGGATKLATAQAAGITRQTLDAWLATWK